jgi:hypothetical protein
MNKDQSRPSVVSPNTSATPETLIPQTELSASRPATPVFALTSPQLRRKIAKILGWKQANDQTWWHDEHGDGPPPDYPNDLNAMHEAEGLLTEDQFYTFVHHITFKKWSGGQYPTLRLDYAQRLS